jgi:molecular chaperone DnaJ
LYKRDYYEILGISRSATSEEIKQAYRDLAFKYHPDRNPGDEEAEDKFKEASEAYQVLSEPSQRNTYDRFGHEGLRGTGFQGFSDINMDDIFSGFSDIFDDFFGFGRKSSRRRGAARGNDIQYEMSITLENAYTGNKRELDIAHHKRCPECRGSGARADSSPETCPRCHGRGQVRVSQGFFSISSTCSQCHGQGTVITDPCPACKGSRLVRETRKISVQIPPGVDSGTYLRISGEGDDGLAGAPPGDLYVIINVKQHDIFHREGNHLIMELPLSFTQAALGDKVEVPTLNGNEKIKIPSGTQSGHIFHLRGRGMPSLRGHRHGDLIIQAKIDVPTKLNARQKELLMEFARASGEDINDKKNFWSKTSK